MPLGMALLKGEVLAFDIAKLAEPLPESVEGVARREAEKEPTDPDDFAWWLGRGGERCHKHDKGKGDEEPKRAAPHNDLLIFAKR
jgi:hypothetical protein